MAALLILGGRYGLSNNPLRYLGYVLGQVGFCRPTRGIYSLCSESFSLDHTFISNHGQIFHLVLDIRDV